MEFQSPLTQGIFIKRTKRYLADVVVNNQEYRTIFCPNMGPMIGCDILGSRVWFSHEAIASRKFPDTWELVEVDGGYLVGINTQYTTALVDEGIQNGLIPLSYPRSYLQIHAVTRGDEVHRGFFPDHQTVDAIKQLEGLIEARKLGHHAKVIFCVQHTGIHRVFPADFIDCQFGMLIRQALAQGVEVVAYGVDISLTEIKLVKEIEVCIPARLICATR